MQSFYVALNSMSAPSHCSQWRIDRVMAVFHLPYQWTGTWMFLNELKLSNSAQQDERQSCNCVSETHTHHQAWTINVKPDAAQVSAVWETMGGRRRNDSDCSEEKWEKMSQRKKEWSLYVANKNYYSYSENYHVFIPKFIQLAQFISYEFLHELYAKLG